MVITLPFKKNSFKDEIIKYNYASFSVIRKINFLYSNENVIFGNDLSSPYLII